jgi:hypothetical protein
MSNGFWTESAGEHYAAHLPTLSTGG